MVLYHLYLVEPKRILWSSSCAIFECSLLSFLVLYSPACRSSNAYCCFLLCTRYLLGQKSPHCFWLIPIKDLTHRSLFRRSLPLLYALYRIGAPSLLFQKCPEHIIFFHYALLFFLHCFYSYTVFVSFFLSSVGTS